MPESVSIDGRVDEWLDRTPPTHPSIVILTLQPTRFFLAFEVTAPHPEGFELELPGAKLPGIGLQGRAGSTHEVNCEHLPWDPKKKLSPRQNRECLAIVGRFQELKLKQEARFRTFFPLAETNSVGTPPTQRKCRLADQRLACEAEYPLSRLPRTSAVLLSEVGFRVSPEGTRTPEAGLWLALPEPVGFEPGLALRQILLPEIPSNLSGDDQYSYQPGEDSDYEIAERVPKADRGMADIRLVPCHPGPILTRFGQVTIRRSCGDRGLGVVSYDEKPTTTFPWGDKTTFIVRGGTLNVITESRWFEDSSLTEELGFRVQPITEQGWLSELQQISIGTGQCATMRSSHNADYTQLQLTCQVLPDAEEGGRTTIVRSLRWSEEEGRYLEPQ